MSADDESARWGPPPRKLRLTGLGWTLWAVGLGLLPGLLALMCALVFRDSRLPSWRYNGTDEVEAVVAVGAVLLVLAGLMCWNLHRHRRLARCGELTDGTITGKRHFTGDPSLAASPAWVVYYTFVDPGGRTYSDKCPLPKDEWDSRPVGATLPVLYDPRRPEWYAPVVRAKYYEPR